MNNLRAHFIDLLDKFLIVFLAFEMVFGSSGRVFSFGLFQFRYIYLIFITFYFWIKNDFSSKKNYFSFLFLIIIFYFCISLINGLLSNEISDVIFSIQQYLYLFSIYTFYLIFNNPSRIKLFINSFIIFVTILSIIVILLFILLNFLPTLFPYVFRFFFSLDIGYLTIRSGFFSIYLKVSPFFPIVFSYYLFKNLKSFSIFNLLTLFILACTIFITFNISIFLSTIVISIFSFYIYYITSRKSFFISLLVPFLVLNSLFLFIVILNIEYFFSFFDRFSLNDQSVMIKLNQFIEILKLSFSRPFFGYGFGEQIIFTLENFPDRIQNRFEIVWLEILLFSGYIGLFIFIYPIFRGFQIGFISIKSKYFTHDNYAVFLSLSTIVVLTVISFSNPYLNNSIGLGIYSISLVFIDFYCIKGLKHA